MNIEQHSTKSVHENHGSVKSYVIGFIISLVLTFNPFYLVTTKAVTGNAVIITILVFAVLQMAVQLLFFLHLGRGPKPLYNIAFFFATAGIIVVTVTASLLIMSNLYRNMTPDEVIQKLAQDENIEYIGGEKTGACAENKENYQVVISDGVATPAVVAAKRCDTLTLINQDNVAYDMIYGSFPIRKSYGGEDSVVVKKDRNKTITLNQLGTHGFYDKDNPDVAGQFVVTE
jgi:cytochrome o ubiquinol oxidase operon protein cyoD